MNWSALMVLVAALGTAAVFAKDSKELSRETDLQAVGALAAVDKRPIVIMFAADHCEYCDRLEADHFAPMVKHGYYSDRALVRKVLIDSYYSIRDFDGTTLSGDELARKYGVIVTPTVLLLDAKGKQLYKKLIGYNGSEYYGLDLQEAIDDALRRYRGAAS